MAYIYQLFSIQFSATLVTKWGFWLCLYFSYWGGPRWSFPELHPGVRCHRGYFQCYWVQLWFAVVTNNFYKNLNIKTSTWTLSTYLNFLNPYQWSRLDVYTDWRVWSTIMWVCLCLPCLQRSQQGIWLCQCATWHKNCM